LASSWAASASTVLFFPRVDAAVVPDVFFAGALVLADGALSEFFDLLLVTTEKG